MGEDRIRFTSAILPRQFSRRRGLARRTKSLDAVLPTQYLRGLSTGDFKDGLSELLGAEASGRKEVLGFRESGQSWRELLEDLRGRGLRTPPRLAVGDKALGFWSALERVFAETAHQRCWVYKTANVLNALPKSRHRNAKRDLHQIWTAADRREAERALRIFSAKYRAKYPWAVRCLEKDRETRLAFYDSPAEHWGYIRTTNPI